MSRELIVIRTIAKRAFDTSLVFNRFHQFLRLKTVNEGFLCRLCLSSRIRNVGQIYPLEKIVLSHMLLMSLSDGERVVYEQDLLNLGTRRLKLLGWKFRNGGLRF
jgi:hypothetical protein